MEGFFVGAVGAGGAAEVFERGQARGAAKVVLLELWQGWRRSGGIGAGAGSRRCEGYEGFGGGGQAAVSKPEEKTLRPPSGAWTEARRRLEVRGFCKGQARAAVWKATGRRLEEPLDAARTRSQPERPLRPGKAWTLQGGMPSSWLEWP